jgi:outer membrane protein OmpA-like peptidoglycan-associated protein
LSYVKKASAAVALILLSLGASVRAGAIELRWFFPSGGRLRLTERADLRKYVDGKFVGLSYREVRGVLTATGDQSAARLEGEFYVFEETTHDTRLVAKRIDDVVPVVLTVRANGDSELARDQADPGYPSLRSFPVLPAEPVEPGTNWKAFGVRVVEPFRDKVYTRVRVYCDYLFKGLEQREGREVAVITAQFAVRYKAGDDPYGDERIKGISGKHVVTITYDPAAGRPIFMSDQVDEQFTLADGKSIAFKGFILTWFEGIEPMDRDSLARQVTEGLRTGGAGDVEVAEGELGVTLTVNSIRFVAEKATVLPEEGGRLRALAETLKKIPDRTFLVVGHTAKAGTVESQERLSVERAKAIVDYLVSQGIPAGRFIYEGRGAREPVAPNDTEANMARNRRVEIVILED